MRIDGPTKEAAFLHRLNRFSALVELEGKREKVYLPNSGRMEELLIPRRSILLAERPSPRRKTRYDLIMVSLGKLWVSVDARMPNQLVSEVIGKDALLPFKGFSVVQREPTFGEGRLDLLVRKGDNRLLIEVKSVTLVRQGKALFPDAPTQRGTRHLKSLIQAKKKGYGAAIIFVIQREDASFFSPNDEADPQFGVTLREALSKGVMVFAYNCKVSPRELRLDKEVALLL